MAERLIECFQNSFNISVEPPQDINKSASKKLVVYSAVLAGFFEDLLGSPSGSGFSIPDVFFTAPYSVKIAFLEGFFTAAGRINLAKKPGNSRYTNQDYNMICRFKSFLYGLGVPTTIGMDITSGGNTTYNLWIPPNDLFGSLFVYDKPATDEQLKKYCIEDDYIACRVLQISSDNESKDADDNDDCIYSIVLEDSNNGDDDNGYVGIISSAGICCI